MRVEDAEVAARLHMEGFGRAWSDGEFAALLLQDPVFGFVARPQGRPGKADGFVLTRLTAGEAEILTIAVARPRRGRGIGRALMDAVLRRLHSERAKELFLEIGPGNDRAIALYRRLGFEEVARRPSYYGPDNSRDGTAVVMRLGLG